MRRPHLFDIDFSGQLQGIQDNSEETIIPGVSVITEGPAEGHFATVGEGADEKRLQIYIDPTTIDEITAAAGSYANGVKVKANHRTGIEAVFGRLTNFKTGTTKGGLKKAVADFHLFKSSPLYSQILHVVKTLPDAIGFSAFFDGPDVMIGDKVFARCKDLFSVDLVGEPAANPTGVFEKKVDSKQKEQGDDKTMTPEEMTQACQAAIAPHMEAINARVAKLEASHTTAASGAPGNPSDDESQYSRFLGRIIADPKFLASQKTVITTELQETAKVLHALGLTPGTGPASSVGREMGAPTPPKKVEDMTLIEIIDHEFAKPENASKTDFEIIREVTLAHPAKHKLALQYRDPVTNERTGLSRMPVRRVPFKKSA